MQKTSPLLLALLAMLPLMFACGPSQAEQELGRMKSQQRADSTRNALADTLANVQRDLHLMQEQMVQIKAELATAEDRLNRVSNFQLLRSRAEREEQIRQATAEVERLRLLISELEPILAKQTGVRDQLEQAVMAAR